MLVIFLCFQNLSFFSHAFFFLLYSHNRDDQAYQSIEEGKLLVPWMGLDDTLFNRFDARHHLDQMFLSRFGILFFHLTFSCECMSLHLNYNVV